LGIVAYDVFGSGLQRQLAGADVVSLRMISVVPDGNRPDAGSKTPTGGYSSGLGSFEVVLYPEFSSGIPDVITMVAVEGTVEGVDLVQATPKLASKKSITPINIRCQIFG